VELLVSPIAELHGVAGYHTSVLVAGTEYCYGVMGIAQSPTISSHKKRGKMQRIFVGSSPYSGKDLVLVLEEYFPPGHYDLLRKNCNAFTDCALFFLCGQRLSWRFRNMDQIGLFADNFGLVQSISAGEYNPNPDALEFDIEDVILQLSAEQTCKKLLDMAAPPEELPMELEDRLPQKMWSTDYFEKLPPSPSRALNDLSKLEAFRASRSPEKWEKQIESKAERFQSQRFQSMVDIVSTGHRTRI
jgi:hypothetical protein